MCPNSWFDGLFFLHEKMLSRTEEGGLEEAGIKA